MGEDIPYTDKQGNELKPYRFKKGNKFGKGNPWARYVQKFRKVLMTCVSAEDFEKVVRRIVQEAQDGDMNAAKLLIERLCGPVEKHIELTSSGPVAVIELPMREFLAEEPESTNQ